MKPQRNSQGMTLVETLMALMVASLVALCVAAGVGAAANCYRDSVAVSESQLLSSTLSEIIVNELRYARDYQSDGSFTSDSYGFGVSFDDNDEGQITLGGYPLLPAAAYSTKGSQQAKTAKIQVQLNNGVFDVKLTIMGAAKSQDDGETQNVPVLKENKFTVTPLNAPAEAKGTGIPTLESSGTQQPQTIVT